MFISTTLISGDYGEYALNHPTWIGFMFSVMATVFIVVALWAYDRGWGSVRLARAIPTTWATPTESTLMFMSVVMLVLGSLTPVLNVYPKPPPAGRAPWER